MAFNNNQFVGNPSDVLFDSLNVDFRTPPPPVQFAVPPPGFDPYQQNVERQTIGERWDYTKAQTERNTARSSLKIKRYKSLNITNIKSVIRQMHENLTKIEEINMKIEKEDINRDCEIDQLSERMFQLEEIFKLYDKNWFYSAEKVIGKRKKKRVKGKIKRTETQEQKKKDAEYRIKENTRIDKWLAEKKKEAETLKREEAVKREADLVLSEVTAKKAEAKKTISLLNALTKLRKVRANQKLNEGENVSKEETEAFSYIVEKLKNHWIDQLQEFNEEEHGLRVMLNDAENVRKISVENETKRTLQNWNLFFFGQKNDNLPIFLQHGNFEEFLYTRTTWDQYSTGEKSLTATPIPTGWVLPAEPSSLEWSQFLKR